MGHPGLLERHASSMVDEALSDTRVVTINGARQVGKSTLARLLVANQPDGMERRLDDPSVLDAARSDPVTFVDHEGLLFIDEVQRAPELFLPIKDTVDIDPRPGRFLLTGSAQVLALRGLPDALPGRMETIELWPLSQGEIDGRRDAFVENAFDRGAAVEHRSKLRRKDYLERVVRGGYPEAVRRSGRRRRRFFESYLSTLIDRDVKELSTIDQLDNIRRSLQLIAARCGGLVVTESLSRDAAVSSHTMGRYLDLLSLMFLIKRIPAWHTRYTKRAVAAPKITMVDSGLACHLLGQDADRLGSVNENPAETGSLIENFALMEIARQLTWSREPVQLFHYRTRDKVEVDAVLEAADGRIVGVEVKARATVRDEDFRGLRHLAERSEGRFVAGIVLYTGQHTLPFGDRFRAMPLSALWELD